MLERYWMAYGATYMILTYGVCVGIAVSMCDGYPWIFNYQLALYILVRLPPSTPTFTPTFPPFSFLTHTTN
jgi:hypothetical protein